MSWQPTSSSHLPLRLSRGVRKLPSLAQRPWGGWACQPPPTWPCLSGKPWAWLIFPLRYTLLFLPCTPHPVPHTLRPTP